MKFTYDTLLEFQKKSNTEAPEEFCKLFRKIGFSSWKSVKLPRKKNSKFNFTHDGLLKFQKSPILKL